MSAGEDSEHGGTWGCFGEEGKSESHAEASLAIRAVGETVGEVLTKVKSRIEPLTQLLKNGCLYLMFDYSGVSVRSAPIGNCVWNRQGITGEAANVKS